MATTKKAATKAKAVKEDVIEEVAENKEIKKETVKEVKPKTYQPNDVINCKSVTVGELVCASKKNNGQIYRWANYGDICEVEYQDLRAMNSTRSGFVYNPQFLILDDDLVKQWKLENLYSEFEKLDDPESFLSLPADELRDIVRNAPDGFKNALVDIAGQCMREGRLDSVSAINVLDSELGTSLKMLI